eukprot:365285-Chlamydomonas_euryale.AAC.3
MLARKAQAASTNMHTCMPAKQSARMQWLGCAIGATKLGGNGRRVRQVFWCGCPGVKGYFGWHDAAQGANVLAARNGQCILHGQCILNGQCILHGFQHSAPAGRLRAAAVPEPERLVPPARHEQVHLLNEVAVLDGRVVLRHLLALVCCEVPQAHRLVAAACTEKSVDGHGGCVGGQARQAVWTGRRGEQCGLAGAASSVGWRAWRAVWVGGRGEQRGWAGSYCGLERMCLGGIAVSGGADRRHMGRAAEGVAGSAQTGQDASSMHAARTCEDLRPVHAPCTAQKGLLMVLELRLWDRLPLSGDLPTVRAVVPGRDYQVVGNRLQAAQSMAGILNVCAGSGRMRAVWTQSRRLWAHACGVDTGQALASTCVRCCRERVAACMWFGCTRVTWTHACACMTGRVHVFQAASMLVPGISPFDPTRSTPSNPSTPPLPSLHTPPHFPALTHTLEGLDNRARSNGCALPLPPSCTCPTRICSPPARRNSHSMTDLTDHPDLEASAPPHLRGVVQDGTGTLHSRAEARRHMSAAATQCLMLSVVAWLRAGPRNTSSAEQDRARQAVHAEASACHRWLTAAVSNSCNI